MNLKCKFGLFHLIAVLLCFAGTAYAQNSFTTLQSGFTQSLFSHVPASTFLGGLAFAQNGDLFAVHTCITYNPPGNLISRFELGATAPDGHGGMEHPEVVGSPFQSAAQCGLTNHPNGFLYANTYTGLAKLDPTTYAKVANTAGILGSGLGVAVDPQTNNVVFVGQACNGTLDCPIYSANPDTLVTSNFAQFHLPHLLVFDGIAFDPSGNYLFLSARPFTLDFIPTCGSCFVVILDRTGGVVQMVSIPSAPDGISFHLNPSFVATNNNDGTLTRLDFPSNDFALPPLQSVLASGGFRGDLSQVGPDGCLYVTQSGTRFNDDVHTENDSIVQLCPNFVPAPGVNPAPGRMTGGGRLVNGGTRVTHGFELHCNINSSPNSLEINWGAGNKFQLESLAASVCFTDTSIDSDPPSAGFNTLIGQASGTYNGAPGATAKFTFTDAGEPGRKDFTKIVIEVGGTTVLSVSGNLDGGNQQAHQH